MHRNDYHVVPKGNHWIVKRENHQRASAVETTQADAIKRAKEFSISSGGGEVSIHGQDGKIRDKRTYIKKDHCPPAG